VDHNYWIGY